MNKSTVIASAVVMTAVCLSVSADPLLYVPTGKSNELVVIDPARDVITAHIPELENAHALAATPDGRYLVAGSMDAAKPQENAPAAKPEALTEEEHRAHHAAGAETSAAGQSYLSIIDVQQARVVRRIGVPGMTHHAAVSPDGRYAVAVHTQLGAVSVTDLQEFKVVNRVATGATPNFALFASDGRFVYVSNAGAGTVSEIDTRTWTKTRDLTVGKAPEHLAWSRDGKTLFVANVLDATVSALAIPAGTTDRIVAVGKAPHGLDVSSDGRWLFVSGKDDGTLTRVELVTGAVQRVALAPEPYHVTYLRGADKLYVSSREAPKIWVIDPSTLSVKNEIAMGPGAVGHQMVIIDRQ